MPLILLALLSCTSPTARSSVEVVSLLNSGDLFTLRMTQGNTGIFAGQSTVRTHFWKRKQSALAASIRGTKADTVWTDERIAIGPQTMSIAPEKIETNIRAEEFSLRFLATPKMSGCRHDSESWFGEVVTLNADNTGWLQAEKNSAPLIGKSLVIRHGGEGQSPNETKWLIGLGSTTGLFYEERGDFSFGCLTVGNENIPLTGTMVQWTDTGAIIEAGKWKIDVVHTERYGTEDPFDHVSGIERTLATPVLSTPANHWYRSVGTVTGPREFFLSLAYRHQGDSPPTVRKRRNK